MSSIHARTSGNLGEDQNHQGHKNTGNDSPSAARGLMLQYKTSNKLAESACNKVTDMASL